MMTGIDILTGLYIGAIFLHAVVTNIKPYVTETVSFEFENSTSNSIHHLGPNMVSGIVANLAVVMLLGEYYHKDNSSHSGQEF